MTLRHQILPPKAREALRCKLYANSSSFPIFPKSCKCHMLLREFCMHTHPPGEVNNPRRNLPFERHSLPFKDDKRTSLPHKREKKEIKKKSPWRHQASDGRCRGGNAALTWRGTIIPCPAKASATLLRIVCAFAGLCQIASYTYMPIG